MDAAKLPANQSAPNELDLILGGNLTLQDWLKHSLPLFVERQIFVNKKLNKKQKQAVTTFSCSSTTAPLRIKGKGSLLRIHEFAFGRP